VAVIHADIKQRALAVTRTLARLGVVRAAYIFGSQAEGRADSWSDIDVGAFLEGIEGWDVEQRARAMVSVMEEVGWDVEAHLFPASELEKPERGSFAEYVVKHGVCIYGK